MPSLFQRRHYEWLAAFARAELGPYTALKLSEALARENPKFNHTLFERMSGIDSAVARPARKPTKEQTARDGAERHAAYLRKARSS